MRGNNFENILRGIEYLENNIKDLLEKNNMNANHFKLAWENLHKEVKGIGLSTYSKLLYFLGINFEGLTCLILDIRLINVFRSKVFDEFIELEAISYSNAQKYYIKYLEIVNKTAKLFDTNEENIEQFLFTFGNNLKNTKDVRKN